MDGGRKRRLRLPTRSAKDYEEVEGLDAGYSQSRRTVRLVSAQLESQMGVDVKETRLLAPFRTFPSTLPPADQRRLRSLAERSYEQKIGPAWKKLDAYLVTSYAPRVREEGGLSSLPKGVSLYEAYVRRSTTTSKTAGEIHNIGLGEVERIEGAMLEIARASGSTSLAEYDAKQLATPGKHFSTKDEMLAYARSTAKTMEPELPRLFGRLPRMPFGIRAVPPDREATSSNFYDRPSLDGTRAGWVNLRTYRPETFTKGETTSVALHEGVPGHHLQRALSIEQENVPEFRRDYGTVAFDEGWALYAESLVDDVGLFQDPDNRYGRLSGERFRSARLVVDTGMHALRWSRQKALEYFQQHAPQARWPEIDSHGHRAT